MESPDAIMDSLLGEKTSELSRLPSQGLNSSNISSVASILDEIEANVLRDGKTRNVHNALNATKRNKTQNADLARVCCALSRFRVFALCALCAFCIENTQPNRDENAKCRVA